MTVVLDASAAVRAALNRQTEPAILRVLDNAFAVVTTDLFDYAVLARREGAEILTTDKRLKQKQLCAEMGVPLAVA